MKKCKADSLEDFIEFVRSLYNNYDYIPLHQPSFQGNEIMYLNECINSTFVSSVGKYVDEFEKSFANFVGSKYAVAVVNGTSALHVALKLMGVDHNSDVITQPLSFVATCNAISYCGAHPIFIDVDISTLGMCSESLNNYLKKCTYFRNGILYSKYSRRKISAVLPMHTFGYPCEIDKIYDICKEYNLPLIEDSAESVGSFFKGSHTGTFGDIGVFSFNGNKIITTGGGGMIVTNNSEIARKAKHISTTSKVKHPFKFIHDEIGFNYRLPNINAAIGCAQMENLTEILIKKEELFNKYSQFFSQTEYNYFISSSDCQPNYWLNTILVDNKTKRDRFLIKTNESGIMTRPAWTLLNNLDIYKNSETFKLSNSEWLENRLINIPSSII